MAFLLVFLFHYGPLAGTENFRWGWVGVDLFFVLSGFLITGILYDTLHSPHFFRVFYMRRALRIFPLFYGVMLLLLIAALFLKMDWNRYSLSNFLYLGNYFRYSSLLGQNPNPLILHYAMPHGIKSHTIPMDHLWSLCVEEQFYLIWPMIVWLVRSRRRLLTICLSVIVAMPVLRLAVYMHEPTMAVPGGFFISALFRIDTLLMGAAVALWLRGTTTSTRNIRRAASYVACLAPLLLAILFTAERVHPSDSTSTDPVVVTVGYTLIALAGAAVLLLAIDANTRLVRILSYPHLASVGRITYGLYIYHFLPITFFALLAEKLAPHHLACLVPIVALIATYVVARLSYQYFELPFLKLKSRFAKQPTGPVPTLPAGSLVTSHYYPVLMRRWLRLAKVAAAGRWAMVAPSYPPSHGQSRRLHSKEWPRSSS